MAEIKIIPLDYTAIIKQTLGSECLQRYKVALDVLRLDAIHPVISGNKWFKLKYYLQDAQQKGYTTIATFGGAYSNHIAATAHTCRLMDLSSVGIIRGEEPQHPSHTLQQASADGMKLIFISREKYRNKQAVTQDFRSENWYWIPEGGYGEMGVKGASEILQLAERWQNYSHVICAVGTGTMLAGLVSSAMANQTVLGISSMKGNTQLDTDVKLLAGKAGANWEILHDYHFGGYGKYNAQLLAFMNRIYHEYHLPLDLVYTSKAMYATLNLIEKNYFPEGSKLLFVHSGGLQGNGSLDPQVLGF